MLELKFKSNHSIITKEMSFYQITKNEKYTIKNKTLENNIGTTYCFGCKDFRPENVEMINKILREKSHCVVWQSNKSRFLKQKIN